MVVPAAPAEKEVRVVTAARAEKALPVCAITADLAMEVKEAKAAEAAMAPMECAAGTVEMAARGDIYMASIIPVTPILMQTRPEDPVVRPDKVAQEAQEEAPESADP